VRVHLVPPPGWALAPEPARRATAPAGDVVLEWSELVPLPEDQAAWIQATLQAGLAPDERLRVVGRELVETHRGWSTALVEGVIEDRGQERGARLAAFYAFLQHAGHARAHAASLAALVAHRSEMHAALLAAQPDFGGPLVAIAEFWRPRR
jgi:hypothetical protein